MQFSIANWKMLIISDLKLYLIIHYNSNELAHYPTKLEVSENQEILQTISTKKIEPFRMFSQAFIDGANINHEEIIEHRLAQQMIILARTYMEIILQDYMTCLFTLHPESMHDYLVRKDGITKENIWGEILKVDTKEALIENLAKRVSKKVIDGDLDAVFKDVARISKIDKNPDLVKRFIRLKKLRNDIVHELSHEELLAASDVVAAYQALLDLLEWLHEGAVRKNVPYMDTIFDIKMVGGFKLEASALGFSEDFVNSMPDKSD